MPGWPSGTPSRSGFSVSSSSRMISRSNFCRRPRYSRARPKWPPDACRRIRSAETYTFSRLGQRRVGVMLGDVASHGFSAALVMALVMAAAGIHAASSDSPDGTLNALLESLSTELARTEMHFSVFYGVLDPANQRLEYASAGHPHAFRIPGDGVPERLEATAPPLGLAAAGNIQRRQVPWSPGNDLLVLWTDGLVDARNESGEPFGEQRLLAEVSAHRNEAPEAVVSRV